MNYKHTILALTAALASLHAQAAADSLRTTATDSIGTPIAIDTTLFEPDGTALPDVVVFGKMKRSPIPFPIRKPDPLSLQKPGGGVNIGSLLGLILVNLFPERRHHKETSKERAERLCRELDRIEPIRKSAPSTKKKSPKKRHN